MQADIDFPARQGQPSSWPTLRMYAPDAGALSFCGLASSRGHRLSPSADRTHRSPCGRRPKEADRLDGIEVEGERLALGKPEVVSNSRVQPVPRDSMTTQKRIRSVNVGGDHERCARRRVKEAALPIDAPTLRRQDLVHQLGESWAKRAQTRPGLQAPARSAHL